MPTHGRIQAVTEKIRFVVVDVVSAVIEDRIALLQNVHGRGAVP